MQHKLGYFVISRENNVLRVDFSRDCDPPPPTFPGTGGLGETIDEGAKTTGHTTAVAWFQ
jgi:hypothetical protein